MPGGLAPPSVAEIEAEVERGKRNNHRVSDDLILAKDKAESREYEAQLRSLDGLRFRVEHGKVTALISSE